MKQGLTAVFYSGGCSHLIIRSPQVQSGDVVRDGGLLQPGGASSAGPHSGLERGSYLTAHAVCVCETECIRDGICSLNTPLLL